MKKIFYTFILFAIGLPIFAVCSITGGACSAPVNFEENSLKDRLIPNNLQQFQKTDNFQPKIVTPYGTNVNMHFEPVRQNPEAGNSNSECQFGECLPAQDNNSD